MKYKAKRITYLIIVSIILLPGCHKKNRPPYTPCSPSGPNIGVINKVYNFSSITIDPNGDSIAIRFDWGDGDTSDWSELAESDKGLSMSHAWLIPDNYNVKVQAKDENELYSKWSLPLIIKIEENQTPVISTPSGPVIGTTNTLYQFSGLAIDPYGDEVAIRFAWGNGDTSDWSNLVPNCSLVTMSYSWSYADTYNVRAQAKDNNENTSEWSTDHQIIIFSGGIPGSLKWRFSTENYISSSPAIGADGTIYLVVWDGYERGYLYAINPNGTLKWLYQDSSYLMSPTIGSDGTIYIGALKNLKAINPDGSLKWYYQTTGSSISSPAIGLDGIIYIGSRMDSCLYAINPDGTLKWRRQTSENYFLSPAIGSDGTIYVSSWSGYLYALNSDGSIKWHNRISDQNLSSPSIGSDGTIYLGSADHCLYAVNTDSTLKWHYQTGGSVPSSPVIGLDSTIYFGSNDNNLYALNPDGTFKWFYHTDGSVTFSPATSSDGTIYFGSYDNHLYALNSDGSIKWHYHTNGGVASSPAIGSDGTIYFGADDGYLYALHSSGYLANSPWPMIYHDLKHTGRVGGGKN